ncbi:MAG: hypothetical protein O8C58_04185, partial [Candidatus Methanoperedens sp.]|nr:hypothetical protein [Candidatus Methanoperedens sp.]
SSNNSMLFSFAFFLIVFPGTHSYVLNLFVYKDNLKKLLRYCKYMSILEECWFDISSAKISYL